MILVFIVLEYSDGQVEYSIAEKFPSRQFVGRYIGDRWFCSWPDGTGGKYTEHYQRLT